MTPGMLVSCVKYSGVDEVAQSRARKFVGDPPAGGEGAA